VTSPTTARRSVATGMAVFGLLATLVAAWAIVAHDVGEGPVVVELTAAHGLHRGEIPELAALAGGLTLCAVGAWWGRTAR